MRHNGSSIEGGIFGPPVERPTSARRREPTGRPTVGSTLFSDGSSWAVPDKVRERIQPEDQPAAGVGKPSVTTTDEAGALRPVTRNRNADSIEGGIITPASAAGEEYTKKLFDRNASSVSGPPAPNPDLKGEGLRRWGGCPRQRAPPGTRTTSSPYALPFSAPLGLVVRSEARAHTCAPAFVVSNTF